MWWPRAILSNHWRIGSTTIHRCGEALRFSTGSTIPSEPSPAPDFSFPRTPMRPESLMHGGVRAAELDSGPAGSRAVVRGYDGFHRLHRGRNTKTYRNVKDTDIARTIAQQVGLKAGNIDDSRTTHDHVSQVNL